VKAGEEYGIKPYGTEVMHVLRAEKGFVIIGQDTDGSVTPMDAGMDYMVNRHKDFLGKRSLYRSEMLRDDRKHLVGLRTCSPAEVLPEGGQIVESTNNDLPAAMLGHVTSSYYSVSLGHSIALALIMGGRSRMGDIVYIFDVNRGFTPAEITSPVFYDPDGERQNV
jgi:sarcosine oxidase subunit alpha